ncbi:MAG: S8 family serine peptidase [Leptolyngbya sp. SIO1E4]|nr:S8 family serine peptidase [Leptolyngbya sp. SIO1E4]
MTAQINAERFPMAGLLNPATLPLDPPKNGDVSCIHFNPSGMGVSGAFQSPPGSQSREAVSPLGPADAITGAITDATLPTDPLFADQWHLQNLSLELLDLNVVDVWKDYTGKGVEIVVIDDGVQHTHPDLEGNYSTDKAWDFENNDADPSGVDGENHGTAVAGIIGAAADNAIGGVGVAYGSTMFGFQTFGNNTGVRQIDKFIRQVTDAIDNAAGLQQQSGINREADIVNMSIGTTFSGNYFDQLPNASEMTVLNTAIARAAIFGRDRLGTILVKSAGNAREINHDTNSSSWNASPHTISVAAIDQDGFVSAYSTHGASVLVSAFGTPGQVITTDRVGLEGYSFNDYIWNFNGTSAAAPMVSGVVALMLEANPNLGWRDIQEILAYSARHVGTDVGHGTSGHEEYAWAFNGARNWNGGGLYFSNDYGFGLVDAKAAVRLAETWGNTPQTSENQRTVFADFLDITTTMSLEGDSLSHDIDSHLDIEYVEVDAHFSQWYDLGDLTIQLTSPQGTSSVLIHNSGENNDNIAGGFSGRWKFFSHAFRGEDTLGTWTVQLFDADSPVVSPITIDDINLTFYGQPASLDDTFIFTQEYSDYVGLWGHSQSIEGGPGTDTINAAAVDFNTTINLLAGTGWIDGVTVSILDIENVFTGDGDDFITGNTLNNSLSGMGGNDNLDGDAGDDILNGGAGHDTLTGGTGTDELWGGDGHDTLIGVAPFEQQSEQAEYDVLTGGKGADTFVLGDAFKAYYVGLGYALITDFFWQEGDTLQAFGHRSSYTLGFGNWHGNALEDTFIYYQNDLIGILQDTTDVVLSLDVTYV